MNSVHSHATPPRWAEALLRVLLKPSDRESVSGDLLEEYREVVVPTRGAGADRWYVRQVSSFLWRASWGWGVVLGGALVIRYLLDTLIPVTDYSIRATALSWTIIGGCATAGFIAAWRMQSISAGALTAFTAALIGAVVSIAGIAAMLAVWHDPATLDAWRSSGGLDEAFIDVPVKLMAIGAAMGTAGALCARGAAVVL